MYDAKGELRSFKRRPARDRKPKCKNIPGTSTNGLVLANGPAHDLLVNSGESEPCEVVVVEGEIDFLTHAERRPNMPVFGVFGGNNLADFTKAIPDGSTVHVRTHNDTAGDQYAALIAAPLLGRCTVLRKQ